MATRKKTNKKPGKGNRIAMSLLAALLLALVIVAGFGMVNANLLRIRKAEVVIPNLPEHFDGTTLLFASDIDLCGLNTPDHAGEVFNQLQSLHPDALILGGDYNSTSLLDKLNRPEGNNDDEAKKLVARSNFFHYINAFQAPLGKYAIASTEDTQWQNLRQVMEENGVKPLINEKYGLHIGDDTLWLVGISGKVSRLDSVATAFSKDDCIADQRSLRQRLMGRSCAVWTHPRRSDSSPRSQCPVSFRGRAALSKRLEHTERYSHIDL